MINSIVETKDMSRTEWLKSRRSGIGGSDVAAILGLNKWKTPLDIYNEKISTEDPVDEVQNQASYFGTILEDTVAKEFARRTGLQVAEVGFSFVGENPWEHGNIDRAVVNPIVSPVATVLKNEEGRYTLTTNAILECKTANARMAEEWGESQEAEIVAGKVVSEHKIPLYYETQVQWYMGITDAEVCYVAVLIGGQDFRIYAVRRDEDIINALRSKAAGFWKRVTDRDPPPPSTKDEVVDVFPVDDGELVEASNEQSALIGDLKSVREQIKSLKEQETILTTRLAVEIGESLGMTIGGKKAITFKSQSTNRFDSTLFKKECPDLYAQYVRPIISRVMRTY